MSTNFPVFKKTSSLFMSGIRWSVFVLSNGFEVAIAHNIKEEWECDIVIQTAKKMFVAGRFNVDLDKVHRFEKRWINRETDEVLCEDW